MTSSIFVAQKLPRAEKREIFSSFHVKREEVFLKRTTQYYYYQRVVLLKTNKDVYIHSLSIYRPVCLCVWYARAMYMCSV